MPDAGGPHVCNRRLREKTATRESARASTIERQRLSLRGLNIQWPFSQLILKGIKGIEVRSHALGHKPHIARANKLMWLIETPGPSPNANANAMAQGFDIQARPRQAQIVGTVKFSRTERYDGELAFRADARNHCIRKYSKKEKACLAKECHAWKVGDVRPLKKPRPARKKSMTGYSKPRSLKVEFLGEDQQCLMLVSEIFVQN